jgi:hypothetical protein
MLAGGVPALAWAYGGGRATAELVQRHVHDTEVFSMSEQKKPMFVSDGPLKMEGMDDLMRKFTPEYMSEVAAKREAEHEARRQAQEEETKAWFQSLSQRPLPVDLSEPEGPARDWNGNPLDPIADKTAELEEAEREVERLKKDLDDLRRR